MWSKQMQRSDFDRIDSLSPVSRSPNKGFGAKFLGLAPYFIVRLHYHDNKSRRSIQRPRDHCLVDITTIKRKCISGAVLELFLQVQEKGPEC
jgi:hypothetical protein